MYTFASNLNKDELYGPYEYMKHVFPRRDSLSRGGVSCTLYSVVLILSLILVNLSKTMFYRGGPELFKFVQAFFEIPQQRSTKQLHLKVGHGPLFFLPRTLYEVNSILNGPYVK